MPGSPVRRLGTGSKSIIFLQPQMQGFAFEWLAAYSFCPFRLQVPLLRSGSLGIGVPPVCSYGYYEYAPCACMPMGYYGPGYFYNGIFLGMGPWAGWGYGHGWGSHRFVEGRGGSYRGEGGAAANRSHFATGGAAPRSSGAALQGASWPATSHTSQAATSRTAASRPTASHAGGGGGHATGGGDARVGGGEHSGGEHK